MYAILDICTTIIYHFTNDLENDMRFKILQNENKNIISFNIDHIRFFPFLLIKSFHYQQNKISFKFKLEEYFNYDEIIKNFSKKCITLTNNYLLETDKFMNINYIHTKNIIRYRFILRRNINHIYKYILNYIKISNHTINFNKLLVPIFNYNDGSTLYFIDYTKKIYLW
jgi:hypothetical protein